MEVLVVDNVVHGTKQQSVPSASTPWWRKLVSVIICMVLMNCMGSLHAISSWNAQLKSELALTQSQIALVTSCASFGFYLAVVPGVVADRIGPRKSVVCCGLSVSLLYLMMAIALDNWPSASESSEAVVVVVFGLGFVAIGQGACFGNFAALVSNEGLFGESHRGKILALLKSSFSAGGALYALVYQQWFDQNVAGYFRFMAGLFLTVCAMAWIGLYCPSEPSLRITSRRRGSNGSSTSSCSSSPCTSHHHPEEEDRVRNDRFPLLFNASSSVSHTIDVLQEQETMRLLPLEQHQHQQQDDPDTDITGRALLGDCRFWLLFVPVFVVVGAAVFVMSNVAFIVESRGGPMVQVPEMIAALSLANTISRLLTGACSDHLLAQQIQRAWFASLACVLTAIASLSFVLLPNSWLMGSMVLVGISEGVIFAIWPVIVREAFGLRHFGKNYGFVSLANVLGFPLVLSPFSALVYHWASSPTHNGQIVEKCFGDKCFQPVFILVLVLCGIALHCSISLVRRYQYVPLR